MARDKSILKAGAWQLLNVGLLAVIQFAYLGYLARLLPKSDFGLIALANIFINFALLLTESGLGPAIIQRKEVLPEHLSVAMFSNILIALVFFSILYFLSGPIALFFDSTALVPVLKILSFNFILQSFGSVSNYCLIKYMRFKSIFFIELFANVLSSLVGIILVSQGWGIKGMLYAALLLTALRALGNVLFNRGNIKFAMFKKQHFSDLYSFGMGVTLTKLTGYMNNFGFQFMIGKMMPLSVLGVFERSYKIMIMPGAYLGNVIDKVMFPGMSRVNDDDEKLFGYYEKMLSVVNVIMIPATALFILYTREIVLVLLGNKWLDAVLPLRILFLSLPFRISVRMCDSVIRAKGKVYQIAQRKLLYTLVLLATVFAGSFWGITAVCVAVSISAIFNYFNMIYLIKKLFHSDNSTFIRPFSEALLLMFYVLLLTLPVYLLVHLLSSYKFLPLFTSLVFLLLAGASIYRFKSYMLGSTLNWLFDRMRLPYRKGAVNRKLVYKDELL